MPEKQKKSSSGQNVLKKQKIWVYTGNGRIVHSSFVTAFEV
jgi:hypothetical protein